MSTAINLGGPEDDERLLSLMARYHEECGLDYDDEHRARVAAPCSKGRLWALSG